MLTAKKVQIINSTAKALRRGGASRVTVCTVRTVSRVICTTVSYRVVVRVRQCVFSVVRKTVSFLNAVRTRTVSPVWVSSVLLRAVAVLSCMCPSWRSAVPTYTVRVHDRHRSRENRKINGETFMTACLCILFPHRNKDKVSAILPDSCPKYHGAP